MGISAVIRINKSSTVSWHTVVYFVYCANSLWYIVSNESWKAACKVHFLSFELAQEIVERTMKILNKNINVMNEEGIIIGSGEKKGSINGSGTRSGAVMQIPRTVIVLKLQEELAVISTLIFGVFQLFG